MDIRELKELLKNSTSVLMMEDGEPSYVIIDYEVYRKLIQLPEKLEANGNHNGNHGEEELEAPQQEQELSSEVRHQLSPQETEALERLNREIQALKEQIEREEQQTQ